MAHGVYTLSERLLVVQCSYVDMFRLWIRRLWFNACCRDCNQSVTGGRHTGTARQGTTGPSTFYTQFPHSVSIPPAAFQQLYSAMLWGNRWEMFVTVISLSLVSRWSCA